MGKKRPQTAEGRPVDVKSYAGYRGAERPRQLVVDGQVMEVTVIVRRWREPAYEYVEVQLATGTRVVLRHTLDHEDWIISNGF